MAFQSPSKTPPKPVYSASKTEILLNILGLFAMLWMVYEVLGISNLFAFNGLSNDDAELARESVVLDALFNPVGFVITTALLAAVIVIFVVARTTTTKVTMIVSIVLYVLSFFRISFIFSMLFASAGMVGLSIEAVPDQRSPAAEEIIVTPAELATYTDSTASRVMTTLTNATDDHWESVTFTVTVQDANGIVCESLTAEEQWLAPGATRNYVSRLLGPDIFQDDHSCVPTSASVMPVSIDIDSREKINESDYRGAGLMPTYGELVVREETHFVPELAKVSVTGSLAPESLGLIAETGSFTAGFEVADAEGRRLQNCFKPRDIAPDGTFSSRPFFDPVDAGLYVTVIPIPEC